MEIGENTRLSQTCLDDLKSKPSCTEKLRSMMDQKLELEGLPYRVSILIDKMRAEYLAFYSFTLSEEVAKVKSQASSEEIEEARQIEAEISAQLGDVELNVIKKVMAQFDLEQDLEDLT